VPIEDDYTVQRWGVEDGLPEGVVTSVAQFPDGFLWLTTPRHVVRFDGVEFVPFAQEDYPAQKPKLLNGLMRDRSGALWVSGENGVMRHDGRAWRAVPLVGKIDIPRGEVWRVETLDGVLEQSPRLVIFWVRETPDGVVWTASNAGVFRFDGQVLRLVPQGEHAVAGDFSSAAMDVRGTIWLVGRGRLFSFDGKTYTSVACPSEGEHAALFQVFAGRDDMLWGKRLDGKLFKREGGAWKEIRPAGLRQATMLEKADGEVWFGAVEGLYRLKQTKWHGLVARGLDKAYDVRCLDVSSDGSLWAGGGNGLFQLKPRAIRVFDACESHQFQTVTALLPREGATFWVGVDGRGLLTGPAGTFRQFITDPPVLNSAVVSALFLTRDGTFWVGTRGHHLWKVAMNGAVKQVRSLTGYASRDVTALAQTADGLLWVGTRAGLLKMDPKTWLEFASGPEDTVLALCADRGDGIWVGTQSRRLWHVDRSGGKRVLGKANGLPSDTVRALHVDEKGRLWMATPKGLAVKLDADRQGYPR